MKQVLIGGWLLAVVLLATLPAASSIDTTVPMAARWNTATNTAATWGKPVANRTAFERLAVSIGLVSESNTGVLATSWPVTIAYGLVGGLVVWGLAGMMGKQKQGAG